MSTWLDDIADPKLRAAYATCGNQSRQMLRNMVAALSMHSWMNTPADEKRLVAARYILSHTKGRR